jgi:hypothetical protein
MKASKAKPYWIVLKGGFMQLLAYVALIFVSLLGSTVGVAALVPEEASFVYDLLPTTIPQWILRILLFLLCVFCIYLAIKTRVINRYGKKITALKAALDLSETAFSFVATPKGVNLVTSEKTFSLGKTVLYLRSFSIDHQKEVEEGTEDVTYEEQIAAVLHDVGQLVCIGQPAEPLPEPGALRIYYKNFDEGWKRIILGLLPTSELIVLRAGTSAGLNWEMEQVRALVNPERFVVLLLGDMTDRLQSLKILESVFQTDIDSPDEDFLPENKEKIAQKRHEATQNIGYVAHFDADWQPKVEPIPVHLGCLQGLFYDDSRTAKTRLKLAFQPVFKRLGLRWRLQLSWLSVLSLGWVAFLVLFLVFAYFYKLVTGHGLLSEL